METYQLATFGDQRRMILETIMALRDGTMDVNRGMVIAAHMKVLNESVQVEINAAKMSINARQAGHDFGQIVNMGRKLLGNDGSQPN